jgi:antitoxin MazE
MEQLKIDSTMDTCQEAVPPEYDLDTLINGITPDNLHAEVSFGTAVGREAF